MVVSNELADFGAFYERTYPRAFGIAFGMTGERGLAEDVTQDSFVAAYRQRSHYRADGPVEAWLYRIVVNTAISALRRRRVRFIVPLDPVASDASEATASGDIASGALDTVALAEGLQRLDRRSRSAVILRYYLDLDYAAIAGILDTTPGNVGAILSRARDRLASYIGSEPVGVAERRPAPGGATWDG